MPEPTPTAPHHALAIQRDLGPLRLAVNLALSTPWTLIYGPSGSGKSSILRAACGLLGAAGINFTRLDPEGSPTAIASPATTLAPYQRALGYAPQNPTLFPHLTVRQNIAFATSNAPETSRNAATVDQAIELFELHTFLERFPRELSGGERQRVNLARAFAVPNARLLLLDEPFSGVDRPTRDALLPRLQSALAARNLPVLSVSHDVDEALLLHAEVITLHRGTVLQQGPASVVLATERQRLLAALQ